MLKNNERWYKFILSPWFYALLLCTTLLGMYLFTDVHRILRMNTDRLSLSFQQSELQLMALEDGNALPLQQESGREAPQKVSAIELRVAGVDPGSVIIRRKIHHNLDRIIESIREGKQFYLRYEPKESRVSFGRLGTVWLLMVDNTIRIDPVMVLIRRQRIVSPAVLGGAALIFLLLPFLLTLRRRAQKMHTIS